MGRITGKHRGARAIRLRGLILIVLAGLSGCPDAATVHDALVTAVEKKVTGVRVIPGAASIAPGGSYQLQVALAPIYASNQAVSWSTSDSTIATVSSTGLVSAVAIGTARIVATTADGGFTDYCNVSVVPSGTSTTGSLQVTVSGLPGGTSANVTVSGPSSFSQNLNGGQTLSELTPGEYTVSAQSVVNGGTTYTASVAGSPTTVTAGSTAQVTVAYTASANPEIGLSTTTLSFSANQGSGDPPSQTVSVTNPGAGTLDGLSTSVSYSSGSGWLSATLDTTAAPATLTVHASTGSLIAAPPYKATISVVSTGAVNSPQTIDVTFTVSVPPMISFTDNTSLIFSALTQEADAPAQSVHITNAGGGTLNGLSATVVSYSSGTGWLSVSLNTTTAPATLTVQPLTQGSSLVPGIYTATIAVASGVANNSPQNVSVTVNLAQGPLLSLSATSLTFWGSYQGTTPGYGSPSAQTVTATNVGGGTLYISSFSYTSNAWIGVVGSTGAVPVTWTIQAAPGAVTPGTYTDTLNILTSPPSNGASVSITFNIAPAQVQNVSASQGTYSSYVFLTWSSAVGATSYAIGRSTTPGGPRTAIGPAPSNFFYDNTATPGTYYYYYIYAITSDGLSSYISNYAMGYR